MGSVQLLAEVLICNHMHLNDCYKPTIALPTGNSARGNGRDYPAAHRPGDRRGGHGRNYHEEEHQVVSADQSH